MNKLKLVQCLLCKKECQLVEGQRGDCRIRINLGGKLTTLVYGKPCAVHVDPIEKKPIFHMLPGSRAFSIATAGCNLHCKFCQNWEISQREPEETVNQDLPPAKVVEAAQRSRSRSIAYTYSEPLVFYEYTLDSAKLAQAQGIKNILVTAGFINKEPLLELCKYTDAANVDLKGFTEEYYQKICGGELQPVLDTLKTMHEQGLWVEITHLIVPTLNDNLELIGQMCDWILDNLGKDVPLHFSRFWPMYKLKNLPPTSVEIITQARKLAMDKGIYYVYVGNVPGHAGNNTYCPKCQQMVIGRIGYMITKYAIIDGKCGKCGFKIAGVWS
jgi:pyruvate formate lyase activating enzyme